jgi:hypothetical protein
MRSAKGVAARLECESLNPELPGKRTYSVVDISGESVIRKRVLTCSEIS